MRRLCLAVLLIAALAVRAAAQGGPWIQLTPQYPTVGTGFTATLRDLPIPAMSASWRQEIQIPGQCTSPTVNLVGTPSGTTSVAAIPGNYHIGVLLTLMDGSQPVLDTWVGINQPTDSRMISGQGAIAAPSTSVLLKSLMMVDLNIPVGPQIIGLAQERLTNRQWWNGQNLPDTDWGPTSPGPEFYQAGGFIFDWVVIDYEPWSSVPIGTVIASWDQQLRLVSSMACKDGSAINIVSSVGKRHFRFIKIDANSYQVKVN
jgi:hypothetical protein